MITTVSSKIGFEGNPEQNRPIPLIETEEQREAAKAMKGKTPQHQTDIDHYMKRLDSIDANLKSVEDSYAEQFKTMGLQHTEKAAPYSVPAGTEPFTYREDVAAAMNDKRYSEDGPRGDAYREMVANRILISSF